MRYPDTAPRSEVLLGLVPVGLGTRNEFVLSAAVRALSVTRFSYIEKYAWMRIPARGFIGWAMQRQIFIAVNHYNLSFTHSLISNYLT
jgi:hypothetical protein